MAAPPAKSFGISNLLVPAPKSSPTAAAVIAAAIKTSSPRATRASKLVCAPRVFKLKNVKMIGMSATRTLKITQRRSLAAIVTSRGPSHAVGQKSKSNAVHLPLPKVPHRQQRAAGVAHIPARNRLVLGGRKTPQAATSLPRLSDMVPAPIRTDTG